MLLHVLNLSVKIIIVLLISVIQVSCVRSGLGIINGLAKSSDFIVHSEIQYGSHQQNKLDIYLPKHQKARATLLFFYGGCWGHCSQLVKNNYLFVAEGHMAQRQFPPFAD